MLERIRAEIAAAGGWIPFARYMELVLQVYYGSSDRQLGARGDFVTAPELGGLFGRTLARQLKELEGPVLELGAGSGALAETLLKELQREYLILETSAALRERQRSRLGDRVRFLDRLPEAFRGVVIANEVVDAMPVHALAWRRDGIAERGVSQHLAWEERPAGGQLLDDARAIEVPVPYESEIGLAGRAWMRSLAERLEQGAIFVIDYGFPRHEYYHPQRSMG
ncbi:MAG: class I SAM-dependent methyltransferase, partial [Burkholderiales bacterium]